MISACLPLYWGRNLLCVREVARRKQRATDCESACVVLRRYCSQPAVQGPPLLRMFAGVPLVSPTGHRFGAL